MDKHASFWQFSLSLYADHAVKDACLALQDTYEADVNLILFLLYQGHLQQQLSKITIQAIDDKIHNFRERVIHPIRALRKSLKGKYYLVDKRDHSLYQAILGYELSAEKYAQAQLATIELVSCHTQDPSEAAANNLSGYATLLGITEPCDFIEILLSTLNP